MVARLSRQSIIYGALILLVLLAQLPIFKPVRDRVRRLYSGPIILLNHSSGRLRTAFQLLHSINDLSKENAALREENLETQAKLAGLQSVESENEQLKKDLNFSQSRPDLKLLPARIINYAPAGSYEAVTIDRGKRDGLTENQAVVSSGYFIGEIKNVSDSTAEVWLLANRNLLTPVLLTSSQTTGVLKGGISGLTVDNIPVDAQVHVGDSIVTSALNNVYPAGIAIGQVTQVLTNKGEIFSTIRVSTPINIATVTNVFIVIHS